MTFWITKCYTSLVRSAAADRTVFATWAGIREYPPAPLDYHQALDRRASHLVTPLCSQLSMFGMETPRAATSAIDSALAVHNGTSPIFQHRSEGLVIPRSHWSWVCLVVLTRKGGGQTGLLPLYVPFNTLISRRQAAKFDQILANLGPRSTLN